MSDPSPAYRVDTSVPLSATHQGDVGPAARPHALTRFGSRWSAKPGMSETRFVTVNAVLRSSDWRGEEAASAGALMMRTSRDATRPVIIRVRTRSLLRRGGGVPA